MLATREALTAQPGWHDSRRWPVLPWTLGTMCMFRTVTRFARYRPQAWSRRWLGSPANGATPMVPARLRGSTILKVLRPMPRAMCTSPIETIMRYEGSRQAGSSARWLAPLLHQEQTTGEGHAPGFSDLQRLQWTVRAI